MAKQSKRRKAKSKLKPNPNPNLVAREEAHTPHAPRLFMTPAVRLALWTLFFLAVLLSVRLVNLWYDLINDEAVYILISADLLDGNLPYTEMYEFKPPGTFLALAAVMGVFGESLAVVRHFGTFCLLVAAVASYAIVVRHTTPTVAGLSVAAVMTLAGTDYFQHTLAEHVLVLWLMPAVWLLVARRGVLWAVFAVGALVSAATLTKTNAAYVALALGGYYLWRAWGAWRGGHGRSGGWEVAVYVAGGALPLAAVVALYWGAGELDLFVFFNVTLPLSYAYGQGQSALGALSDYVVHYWQSLDSFYPLVRALFIAAGVACLSLLTRRDTVLTQDLAALGVVFVALALSTLHGHGHLHYLLVLLPFAAVFTALGWGVLHTRLAAERRASAPFLLAPALILACGFAQYGVAGAYHLFNRWDTLGQTPLQQVAELIREDGGGSIYAPQQTALYWYLDQPSPSKLIQPANLGNGAIINPLTEHGYLQPNEYRRVLTQEYDYWVMRPDSAVWKHYHPNFRAYAYGIRDSNYKLWKHIPLKDQQFDTFNGGLSDLPFNPRKDLTGFDIYKRR